MSADAPETSARAEVLRLHYVDELSIRQIAKRLNMARKTVRKHLGRARPKEGTSAPRPSLLDPYLDTIRRELERTPELRAPAMMERLRPLGYVGGISILRERMRALRPEPIAEAFHTVRYAPGQAMLIDWADFGFALPGVPRRVSAFVAVLGHSRMLHLEFALSQKQGTLLRCLDRAVRFFGGVTLVDILDNMKTAVLEHRPPHDPVFHPRFVGYAAARGFAPIACNPYAGHEKGPVERGIGFVRRRFWPGRRFADLEDLNHQAFVWRDTYANAREHELTGKVPRLVFENTEQPALAPAKSGAFDTDDLGHGGVTKPRPRRVSVRDTRGVSRTPRRGPRSSLLFEPSLLLPARPKCLDLLPSLQNVALPRERVNAFLVDFTRDGAGRSDGLADPGLLFRAWSR